MAKSGSTDGGAFRAGGVDIHGPDREYCHTTSIQGPMHFEQLLKFYYWPFLEQNLRHYGRFPPLQLMHNRNTGQ
jgi:hypothetical protein